MSDKKIFHLVHKDARRLASEYCLKAPEGEIVRFSRPTRSLEQNAKFHALCGDLAYSGLEWAGKPRSAAQWKVLLVSAHAVVTKEGAEIVPGLEGEFVNLRESTALMSVSRGASLIEYVQAFVATNEVVAEESV